MKILLLNPPNLHPAKISVGWDLEIGNIGLFPPYGLMSLAAYVRRERRDEVFILDCIAERIGFDDLSRRLHSLSPDIVGITAFTYTFYDVLNTARIIRKVLPCAHICLGGPHGWIFPQETMSHLEFDSLVLGDGEIPFTALLEHIKAGATSMDIEGLTYRNNGVPKQSQRIACVEDLDALPFPAFDLIPSRLYKSTFGRAGKMACLCTSRGCPFQCTFCQVLVKKFRKHSVAYVINLIQQLYKQGYRNFYFFDDLFNITAQRVIEISEAILGKGLKVSWVFRGRADQISKEMVSIAAKAGCCQILLGVEDYTNEGLRSINKGITIEQVFRVIEWAHAFGLEVSTNWIIGLPSHKSAQDIKDLVRTSINSQADYAQYTILQLLPGSKMFEDAVREGALHSRRWPDFVYNPIPGYRIEAYEKHLSIEELSYLYKECHSMFYKRPAYLFNRISKVRTIGELVTKAKVGWKILWK